MKKKKIILINPAISNPLPGFPPLGLGYVAALTPDYWDIEIIDENFEVAYFEPCDLVGLTGFTAYARRAYQIAKMYQDKNVPIVMGGIHASMMPDEALQHVDTVVIGEAESVWRGLIADFEAGNMKQKYSGIHTDLKGLVYPRRDLFSERYYGDSIQTSRGCPNDCEFCSVTQFNGFKYRRRPVEEVLDEMETLKKRFLFIVDDNIVGSVSSGEEYAIALTKGMVERKLKKIWYSHAALNVADNEEVLKAFRKSGCKFLFLGVEAENPEVLQNMNKRVNLARKYEEVFRKIHKHHIGIHGSLIFGTDDDTIEMLEQRFVFMKSSHIDILQYCTLTPYPGTKLFDAMLKEGRLFYADFPDDWDRYDLSEILFKPRNLDVEEYKKIMRRIAAEIFTPKSRRKRFFRSLLDTRRLISACWCLIVNKIYRISLDNGRAEKKFWYLDSNFWPLKSRINHDIDIYRKKYWMET